MIKTPPRPLDKKIDLKVIAPPKQKPNEKRKLLAEIRNASPSQSPSPKKPDIPAVPLSKLTVSQPVFDETIVPTQDISAHTTEPGSLRETMIFGNDKNGMINGEWVRSLMTVENC
jgi:hypothetical protein